MDIKEILPATGRQIINEWCTGNKSEVERGRYWYLSNEERYIGIDNSSGECFVGGFDTMAECVEWLSGGEYAAESDDACMTVGNLIDELQKYDRNLAVRIVDRTAGWDSNVFAVLPDTYGIDPEKQMAICIN